jgi:hypothetical protein
MTIINPASAANSVDLTTVDVETALLLVQTQRANALEDQLKDQMVAVQQRNRDIETMNAIVAEVRANRPDGEDDEWYIADAGSYVEYPVTGETAQTLAAVQEQLEALEQVRDMLPAGTDTTELEAKIAVLEQAAEDLQADPPPSSVVVPVETAIGLYGIPGYEGGKVKQDSFDALITTINSKIDSLNSTQQMDMLRLQSLTNKRNEAFDLMTNYVKKVQDSRSSIVSNMR